MPKWLPFLNKSTNKTSWWPDRDGVAVTTPDDIAASDRFKVPRVNSAGTDFELVDMLGTPFQISIKTDNAGTSLSNQFTLRLNPAYLYDFYVGWGDGQFERWTSSTSPTHTYAAIGTYTVSIWGTFPAIRFNGGGDRLKLLTISQWGSSVEWLSMSGAFNGCSNLAFTATAADSRQAKTGKVRDWSSAFALASSIAVFPDLDFSSALIIDSMLRGCTSMTSCLSLSFPSTKSAQSVFRDCTSLTALTGFFAPSCNLFSNLCNGCTALASFVSIGMGAAFSLDNAMRGCSSLTLLQFDHALPGLRSAISLVENCTLLTQIKNMDVRECENFSNAFSGAPLIDTFLARNIRASFSVGGAQLSATAIDTLFSNLATLATAGSQTITITGNPGATGCKPLLAIDKGWVVVGGPIDPDAQAFITAVGTLTVQQQAIINCHVIRLKSGGTWWKYSAIYPFIGGTAAAHKWNLKNPVDSDAAYRLLFVGASHQHTANGYKNTSATANSGADTRLNPFIAQTITNASYSVYSRTDGAQDSRELRANDGTYRVQLSIKWSDGSTYLDIGDQASGESVSLATTAALGLFQVSRSSSNQLFATPFASGSSISTAPALPNTNIVISSDPFGGGFTREIAYATIGQGLTLAEMNADRATINAYQTALGRAV
jgi:hypothetical protein